MLSKLIVAVELVPEGGVLVAVVSPGEPVRVPLSTPLKGKDGTVYEEVDIVVEPMGVGPNNNEPS